MYKYQFESLLSILLGTYPEVELLDHTVILFLISEALKWLILCYENFTSKFFIKENF